MLKDKPRTTTLAGCVAHRARTRFARQNQEIRFMRAKFLAVLAILALAPTALSAAPAGWITAKSRKGQCQAMVPGSWKPGFAGIGMDAPGSKASALVSNKPGSIADTKATLPKLFKVTKAYEDSANRYWVEYTGEISGKRHWYVVTPAASGICTAVIDFDSSLSEADAKTIAISLSKY